MKKRIGELAKELGVGRAELLAMAKEACRPGMTVGRGGNMWITDEGQELLAIKAAAPLAVTTIISLIGLHPAANRRWLFCRGSAISGKVPVLLPTRIAAASLVGKSFDVEVVRDGTGATYRHASLS